MLYTTAAQMQICVTAIEDIHADPAGWLAVLPSEKEHRMNTNNDCIRADGKGRCAIPEDI